MPESAGLGFDSHRR